MTILNSKPEKIRSKFDGLYAITTSNPKYFICTFSCEANQEAEIKEFGKTLMREHILTKTNPIAWVQTLIDQVPNSDERRLCKRHIFAGMLEEAKTQNADPEIITMITDFLAKQRN